LRNYFDLPALDALDHWDTEVRVVDQRPHNHLLEVVGANNQGAMSFSLAN
jgi:hypothetical protein